MRRVSIGLFFLAMVLFVTGGCGGGVKKHLKKGELKDVLEKESREGRYIQTVGIGAADQSLASKTQRRATSRNAAIVMAQYEMLSIVKGINLEGGVTVQQAMETDSKISAAVNDYIKGAEVIQTEWTEDDGCVVTLRLERKRLEELVGKEIEEE